MHRIFSRRSNFCVNQQDILTLKLAFAETLAVKSTYDLFPKFQMATEDELSADTFFHSPGKCARSHRRITDRLLMLLGYQEQLHSSRYVLVNADRPNLVFVRAILALLLVNLVQELKRLLSPAEIHVGRTSYNRVSPDKWP
jgi:hypothetical protein